MRNGVCCSQRTVSIASKWLNLWLLLCVLLMAPWMASGQTGNGRVRGTVDDPQRRAVPGADVLLTNEGTASVLRTKSNASGEFVFPQVPLGQYSLKVIAGGFENFQQTGIQMTADQNLTLPVALTVGGSSETVTVSEAGTLVDTQTGTLKSTIDSKSIEDLPLSGRDVRNLVALSQGVAATTATFNSNNQSSSFPNTPEFSVNGNRANAINYLLDGIDNNDSYTNISAPYPDPDALAEFSVQVSNFDAEYGRNAGAIVNAITRSGTNKIHGSVYEFTQNSTFGLDALDSVSKYNGGTIPINHFNQFGGSIGGPVFFPHLYNGHDRTFFFGSFEETLIHRASQVAQATTPTAAERSGNLAALGVTLRDPLTGQPFANNTIPAGRLDPAALQFLSTYQPLPNAATTAQPNLFTFRQPNTSSQGQLTLRGDQSLPHGNKLALTFYRYGFLGTELPPLPGNINYAVAGYTGVAYHGSLGLTTVFSSRAVNLLSIGYSHLFTHPGAPPAGYPTSQTLGLKVYSVAPNPLDFSISGFTGAAGVGGNGLPNDRNNFPVTDAFSLQLGRHEVKFGGGADYQQQHWVYNQAFPNFYFSGQYTGTGLGDFLLGYPDYLVEANTQILDTRFTEWFAFAQDNWKVSHRLSLDLGLRWEPFIPPHFNSKYNPIGVFSATAFTNNQHSVRFPNAPPGYLFGGDAGVPEGGTPAVYKDFSPRVGFAYDLRGNQRTVIRGAYGLFYDQPKAIDYNRFTNNQPFNIYEVLYNVNDPATSTVPVNPYNWRDPYQGGVDPVGAFASQANNPPSNAQFSLPIQGQTAFFNFHSPYVQQWNLTLEQQLPLQTLLRVTYVGNKGTHLQWTRDANAPQRQAGPSSTWASTQARRPYNPGFGYITGLFWDGYNEYQGVQVSLEHRFNRGLSTTVNFNHSRDFDSNSDGQEFIATGIQNPYNLRQEYGPSDLDIPNNFVASFVYDLPIPSTGNHLADAFVRGYQLNGIVSIHSAPPFSVYSTTDNELTTEGYQRDKLIGNPNLTNRGPNLPFSPYYNPEAYDQTYTPDNDSNISGRNSLRGPGYADFDLSAFKNVKFEKAELQLRLETFNTFNHPNLGINGQTQYFSSPDFGKLTTDSGGRTLQFGAHLSF